MRNLNDLCDATNDIALEVLRYSLHVFTHRDLSAFNPLAVALSKAELACKLTIGSTEFPVLSCVTNSMECCTINTPSQANSVSNFLRHFVDFQKRERSVVSSEKHPIVETITSETDGPQFSTKVNDIANTSGLRYLGDLSSSFLSLLHYTSISLPVASPNDSTYSKVGSFVNIPSALEGITSAGNSSSSIATALDPTQSVVSVSSSDSYQDALSYPECNGSSAGSSIESTSQVDGRGRGTTFCHSISVVSTETVNIPTSALDDDVREMMKPSQISLLKLCERFSYVPHIVYSFFIGRVVVVTAKASSARSVSSVVYGLANLLPNNPVKPKRICASLSGKLTLSHLGDYGIIGIVKHKDKNPVPMSLRPYVSIMDLDKDCLEAPLYQGKVLWQIFNTSHSFSESSLRKFIKQWWADLIAESYVRFTNNYTHQLSPYNNQTTQDCLNLDCDQEIKKYFMNTLKMQVIYAYSDDDIEGLTTDSIYLNNKKCQKIQNQSPKRKNNGKSK